MTPLDENNKKLERKNMKKFEKLKHVPVLMDVEIIDHASQ